MLILICLFDVGYTTCSLCTSTCAFLCASEDMTSPKADRDLLICCASFNLSPVTSDLSTRSLPARSTKCIQPRRTPPDVRSRPCTCTVKQLRLSKFKQSIDGQSYKR
ncbi:hypothetical protein HanLR1_Chr01g0000911 [Helianthus annuus]|nr:hypothetical protein HanHA89_Chr01g0000961 [Helianthus annuus]KAJ0781798.1 hypothetical protein HanLR1_Chr01g0000911 [Helianthus annuus]